MSLQDIFESNDLRHRFETAGYSSLEELRSIGIIQLAQDIELTAEEVGIVESVLHKGSGTLAQGISAANLVKEQHQGITTSCRRLDHLFAPFCGIPRRSVTELSGAPGSGKTQFCIQLSLNVQHSTNQGGLGGECIYIDTEGGLMEERFHQMAQTSKETTRLTNIHYFRVLDHLELIALVHQLPNVLKKHPKVKLLIVDSIAHHLRHNITNHRTRIGILNFIGQVLVRLADQFSLSIVVTNQAALDMMFGTWRPSLGPSWSQWCTHRIVLTRQRHQRHATMYSAQQMTKPMAPFLITATGIEDVDEETLARIKQYQDSELDEETLATMKQWQESQSNLDKTTSDPWQEPDLDTEDPLSPTVLHDGNGQDVIEDDVVILAPDSQPEHSYADLSAYFTPDPSAKRRQLSPAQDSEAKRKRSLGDVDDSFEIVYDSQDDNAYDSDELFVSSLPLS